MIIVIITVGIFIQHKKRGLALRGYVNKKGGKKSTIVNLYQKRKNN